MKKCVCCLRKLQLQKDCSGGNQSNNFKFIGEQIEQKSGFDKGVELI